jgi:YbbR domain-containing protein
MEWWQKNLALKLIALTLAVVTWFYVDSVTSEWRTIERVPVQVRGPAGLVARLDPPTVDVVIRGAHEDLRQVSRQDLYVAVDLDRTEKPGQLTVTLPAAAVRHPPRIQVVEVRPPRVVLQLEAAR